MKQQTPHHSTSEFLNVKESLHEIQKSSLRPNGFERRSITELLRERLLMKVGLVDGDGSPEGWR